MDVKIDSLLVKIDVLQIDLIMIRIANFVLDEKFIDGQIDYHDLTKEFCTHDYFLVRDDSKPLKFIKKHKDRINIIKSCESLEIANEYDAVFLHTIYGMPLSMIPKINKKVKVFWFSWGFDIYSSPMEKPLVKIELLHSKTKRYVYYNVKEQFFRVLFLIYNFLKKRNASYFRRAVSRINYFSGVIPEEYDLVKSANAFFSAVQVDYSYSSVSEFVKQEDIKAEIYDKRTNIIIGNSTAYENNHLDAIYAIKDLAVGDMKIYMPLSYSPNPKYVKMLTKKGKKIFGGNFVPLTKFLPMNEYYNIVKSCGIAIFAIERQMAIGNIKECLKNGAKLFFYKDSILYRHFTNLGVKVFTIEDDLPLINSLEPLSYSEVLNNRKILYERYNINIMKDKLYKIYSILS